MKKIFSMLLLMIAVASAHAQTADDIIHDFPELTQEDIHACLSYAADAEKHTKLLHQL